MFLLLVYKPSMNIHVTRKVHTLQFLCYTSLSYVMVCSVSLYMSVIDGLIHRG